MADDFLGENLDCFGEMSDCWEETWLRFVVRASRSGRVDTTIAIIVVSNSCAFGLSCGLASAGGIGRHLRRFGWEEGRWEACVKVQGSCLLRLVSH